MEPDLDWAGIPVYRNEHKETDSNKLVSSNGRRCIMTHNTRRGFLRQMSLGAGIAGIGGSAFGAENTIQGFDETDTTARTDAVWQPISDRKVRVGIVGYGVCRFGALSAFRTIRTWKWRR